MRFEKEEIQLWLESRNSRESMLIFLAGFAVVYLFWNLFFGLPLHSKMRNLESQKQHLMREMETKTQNLASIERVISSSSFSRNLLKQKSMSTQSNSLGSVLKDLEQSFIPVEWLARLTNDVIAQQDEVILISMKTFSEEPWLKTQGIKESSLYNMQDVYKHEIELELQGSYFNVVTFLEHLEKLPWHLYWDKLNYQVAKYPEAKVVARFYVLTRQGAGA